MKDFRIGGSPDDDDLYKRPTACPACRSSSIVTTTRVPDASSYWRCTKCGEVWNDSRRQAARYGDRWSR